MATKSLTFMEAVKTCFKKYATFKGRARRSEFWWFMLAINIPSWILGAILQQVSSAKSALVQESMTKIFAGEDVSALAAQEETYAHINLVLMIIMAAWALFTLIPSIAAAVRRLHDVGKSGHMLWLCLVCGIGGLIPMIMCIPDGKPGANQYGESPKYIDEQ